MGTLRFGRYDYAVCSMFAVYAACSMVAPMTLVAIAADLGFPLGGGGMGRGGALQFATSLAMLAAMLVCGFVSGLWGKRRTLGGAAILMGAGVLACAFAPGYGVLAAFLVVAGLGEGVMEGLANPFIQELHPDEPGRYLNFSHAFWSIGVVGFTLAAGALLYAGLSWRALALAVGLASALPALLYLWSDPSRRDADRADRSHWREVCADARFVMRQRRFWLFFAAMFFAGGGEFCLTFWCASFIQIAYGGTAWAAGAGTAFFAGGMTVGRIGSGYLVRQRGLKTLIVVLALAATLACFVIPLIESLWTLFALLFFPGVAAGPFWPSIQSLGTMRVAGNSTVMMILYACAGIPGCGVFTLLMGLLGDAMGLRLSFLLIPTCFLIVFILIGLDWLAERGGGNAGAAARTEA